MWEEFTDPEARRIAEKVYRSIMLIPLIYMVGCIVMYFPLNGSVWSPFIHIDAIPFFVSCFIAGFALKTPSDIQNGTVQPADADLSKSYRFAHAVALSFLTVTILVIWFLLREDLLPCRRGPPTPAPFDSRVRIVSERRPVADK